MNIAVVIERIEAWRGGAETSTLELVRLLAARRHEMHILTSSRSPSPPDMRIHTLTPRTPLRPLRTAGFLRLAGAFLRQNAFDVVHSIVPLPEADFYQPRGGLLAETQARNVATRSTNAKRLLKRAMMKFNVKQQALLDAERRTFERDHTGILAVSNYVAEQCRRHYGLGPPRVRVIMNGVNVTPASDEQIRRDRREVRARYEIADDQLALLFVAHNFRLKGLGPLIECAGKLVARGFTKFRVLVVGRDNPIPFQRRVEELKLHDRVVFTGPTQRSTAFFHAADACLHPTYYDPCSRVVLEALSRGVPCMTTRFNGAAEFMTEGREGFILDSPDDTDAWCDRIAALSSPDLRARMSASAVQLRDRVSMTRHVDELDALFRQFAARPKERTRTA